MAAMTQLPSQEKIVSDIMREMKRSAADVIGESPIQPLDVPSRRQSPPILSPTDHAPLSPLLPPPTSPNSPTLPETPDTDHVLAITRSYAASPTDLLEGGMLTDKLPPSPSQRRRTRASSPTAVPTPTPAPTPTHHNPLRSAPTSPHTPLTPTAHLTRPRPTTSIGAKSHRAHHNPTITDRQSDKDERPSRIKDDRPRDRDNRPRDRDDRPRDRDVRSRERRDRDDHPTTSKDDRRPKKEDRPVRDDRDVRTIRDEQPARNTRDDRTARDDRPTRERAVERLKDRDASRRPDVRMEDREVDRPRRRSDREVEQDRDADRDRDRNRERRGRERERPSRRQDREKDRVKERRTPARADTDTESDSSSGASSSSAAAPRRRSAAHSASPSSLTKKRRRAEEPTFSRHRASASPARPPAPKKSKRSLDARRDSADPPARYSRVVIKVPKPAPDAEKNPGSNSKTRRREVKPEAAVELRSERKVSSTDRRGSKTPDDHRGSKRRAERELSKDEDRNDARRERDRDAKSSKRAKREKVEKLEEDTKPRGKREARPLLRSEPAERRVASARGGIHDDDRRKREDGKATKPRRGSDGSAELDGRNERKAARQSDTGSQPAAHRSPAERQGRRARDGPAEPRARDRDWDRAKDRGAERDRTPRGRGERGSERERALSRERGEERERVERREDRDRHTDRGRDKARRERDGSGDGARKSGSERPVKREAEPGRDAGRNREERSGEEERSRGGRVRGGEGEKPRGREGGLQIRSYPVDYAARGSSSAGVSPVEGAKVGSAKAMGGAATKIRSGSSSGAGAGNAGTPSPVVPSAGASGRSGRAEMAQTKAKIRRLESSYKAELSKCADLFKKKEYEQYEEAARDSLRLGFDWALARETELRLTEHEFRRMTVMERMAKRKPVISIYRDLVNNVAQPRVAELESINRKEATNYFKRGIQKAYLRMFALQRLWGKELKQASDSLQKSVGEVCRARSNGSSRGGPMDLDDAKMKQVKTVLDDFSNSLTIAEQLVSDFGDGHEEAGSECRMCWRGSSWRGGKGYKKKVKRKNSKKKFKNQKKLFLCLCPRTIDSRTPVIANAKQFSAQCLSLMLEGEGEPLCPKSFTNYSTILFEERGGTETLVEKSDYRYLHP